MNDGNTTALPGDEDHMSPWDDRITPEQREYLLGIGMEESALPESAVEATQLIGASWARLPPTEKQLARLQQLVPSLPPPKTKMEASDLIGALKFVNACARKKFSSPQCVTVQHTWMIAEKLLRPIRKLRKKLAETQAAADETEKEATQVEKQIEESELKRKEMGQQRSCPELDRLDSKLEKLRQKTDKLEDKEDKLEEKIALYEDQVQDVEPDLGASDPSETIPSPGNRMQAKVSASFRMITIQAEYATKPIPKGFRANGKAPLIQEADRSSVSSPSKEIVRRPDVDVGRPKKRRFLFPKITIVEGPVEGFFWLCIILVLYVLNISIRIFAGLVWCLAIAIRLITGVFALGYIFAKLTSDKRRRY